MKRFGDYWRRAYECPFYQTNQEYEVRCEAGLIKFTTVEGVQNFLNTCETEYRRCPIYKALMIDYDTKEREEFEEKCREYASRNRGT